MSIEEFNVQYDRALKAVQAAQIPQDYKTQVLSLLTDLRRLVDNKPAGDTDTETKAMELLQKIIVAVALEEGRLKQAAGA